MLNIKGVAESMLKIGMLSKWHVHAEGYAKAVERMENAEVAAVWDDNAERGQKWADELGCPYYRDLGDMLAVVDPRIQEELREETPLMKLGNPSDIAKSVCFLCSPAAGFITGQVLGVNGGFVI